MNRLHLQLALDHCSLDEACALARRATPYVDTIEVGTPLLMHAGVAAIARLHAILAESPCDLFADSKISDEGAALAAMCLEAGADAVSVVDGASRRTLQEVRSVADEFGKQVWVDLIYHSNPIIRAQALSPYVDGFVLHRPPAGFPRPLIDGFLTLPHPIRLAGGLTLDYARRAAAFQRASRPRPTEVEPLEGMIIGRAITHAEDVEQALRDFAALCHPDEQKP